MATYDFSGNSQWGSLYSMGGASQSILPHVPHATQPLSSSWDHSSPYLLTVKQHPERAKAANAKDKDRKPIDPPPILQLDVDPSQDPLQVYITSPYLFVQTFLIGPNDSDPDPDMNTLAGNTCTSGHVVKDDRGVHNMMFCLNDISVKKEGTYRLRFCLFKLNTTTGEVEKLTSVCSEPFTTYSGRHFPGMSESTSMTRLLVDAGVRLRLRKESKAMSTKKKNTAFAQMMSGRGREDDDDRPMKRLRSEPGDDNPMSYSKHGNYSTAHSYTTHSGSSSSMAHFPGAYHAVTSSPGQNIAPLSSMPAAYNTALHSASPMLGLDTQVSHYHNSPASAGSSYQSPGRQSPTTGYPLHVSTSSSQGLVATSPLGHYSSSHSAQPPILPPVDMSSSQASSSPDINYTTSASYGGGGYMPSRGLPSMQHRTGSMSSSIPMRMHGPVYHNGHSVAAAGGHYGEGMFDPYHYGPRDGH